MKIMASEYKVGTISSILASQSKGSNDKSKKQKKQAKLAALFSGVSNGSSTSQVFRTIKVSESQVFTKSDKEGVVTGVKEKVRKNRRSVKPKDVEETAVTVKETKTSSKKEVDSKSPKSPKEGKKKEEKVKQKKAKNATAIQDSTVTTTSPAPTPQSLTKAEKKKLKKERQKAAKAKQSQETQNGVEEEPMEVDLSPGTEEEVKKTKKSKRNKKKVKAAVEEPEPVAEKDEESDEEDPSDPIVQEEAPAKKTVTELNAPKPKDEEKEARTIFIGNLPSDTDKKALLKIFKKMGKLETVRLRCVAPNKPTVLKKVAIYKKEHHPDKSTLAAYIRFSSREEAEEVVEKARGMVFKDHHLVVDLAVPGKRKDTKKAVFVGNLDMKLSDEELWRFFEDCGKISSVRIIRGATGLGKGFGYVNFYSTEAIESALQKDNQPLRNRAVRVKKCVKKLKIKKHKGSKNVTATLPEKRLNVKKEKEEGKLDTRSTGKAKTVKPGEKRRPARRDRERTKNWTAIKFEGDKLAEIGKLKRKSNKPNRGELRKTKFAKLLGHSGPAGKSVKQFKKKGNFKMARK